MIDLYLTTRCPRGVRCEACGSEAGLLAPWTVRINRGVFCLTLCPRCTGAVTREGAIPVADSTARRLVEQHCQHLEINTHQMGLILAEEDRQEAAKTAAAAETAALTGAHLNYIASVVNGNGPGDGHGVYPPDHPHVYCSVCTSDMVHIQPGTDRYAAHPMIAGEPTSAQCTNTDFPVGTHRGGPIPSPRRR